MRKKTARFFAMKRKGQPIAVLTGYDAPTAKAEEAAGTDIILVGDSVGTNMLGYASERDVTLADMCHHVGAVRRGAPKTTIIADLPYRSYDTPEIAVKSSRLLIEAGADIVKFEGPRPEIVEALARASIEVCCHLGLEPQHHDDKRLKGQKAEDAARLLADAIALDGAGMAMLVLELVPEEVADHVTRIHRRADHRDRRRTQDRWAGACYFRCARLHASQLPSQPALPGSRPAYAEGGESLCFGCAFQEFSGGRECISHG